MKFDKSNQWYERALKVTPIAAQTYSKSPMYYPIGASPLALVKGEGAHVWDLDGNEFVDWVCALGPITLGYRNKAVDNAVLYQILNGPIFSLSNPLETELAELLRSIIRIAEMSRFFKTGSEACSAAVRIARAHTRRDMVLTNSYHGWHNEFAGLTERPYGVPTSYTDSIIEFPYDDIERLEVLFSALKDKVACVIMEPVVIQPPSPGYIRAVKDLCHENGALLIFDEVVTGFRWDLGGASKYFSVEPDLMVIGKGMANGYSLSGVCGPKEIMQGFENVMVSSTFAGNCVDLAAGIATITEMRDNYTIEQCWEAGTMIIDYLLLQGGIKTRGYSCRPMICLPNESPEAKTLFLEQMIQRGHLIVNSMVLNICYAHSRKDVDSLVDSCVESVDYLKDAIEKNEVRKRIQGTVVKSAFKRI